MSEVKLLSGVYDYDEVLIPGSRLIDEQILENGKGMEEVKKATNAYGDQLFEQQISLVAKKQELELERNIFSKEYFEIKEELEEIERLKIEHFRIKDQVLEETEPQYVNLVNYSQIYRREYLYPGVCEAIWEIYDRGVYAILFDNSHTNTNNEEKYKGLLLKSDFPPMIFVPVRFHILPYRDREGFIIKDRHPSDKVLQMYANNKIIDPSISTYVDNSRGVLKCAKKIGFRTYLVEKGQDPRAVIIQAANDTIDKYHDGKIKKLSL